MLMQQFATMADVEAAHLAAYPARVEAAATADAATAGDFLQQCIAPSR